MTLGIQAIAQRLEAKYGRPAMPPPRTAFEWVVHENACYLVSDERRDAVFLALRRRLATRREPTITAKGVLAADRAELLAILSPGGMKPEMRLEKLLFSARLCVERHAGDLDSVFELPEKKALTELARYPGIGKPSAEKILLFVTGKPRLPLDSNGLRVMLRLGYGEPSGNYAKTYESVRHALPPFPADSGDSWKGLHLALRHHGKETCTNKDPCCGSCPLVDSCERPEIAL